MKHRYSGNKSRKFWNRIARFSGLPPHDALYAAGCELQNLEEAVLQTLELAEKQLSVKTPYSKKNDATPESTREHASGLKAWLGKGNQEDWLVIVDCHV